MRRLIIIGNGFDLSLGLKTSYNQFLVHHIKEVVKKLYNNTNHVVFVENIGNTYTHPEDDLVQINISRSFAIKSLYESINSLTSLSELCNLINKYGKIKFKLEILNHIQENRNIHNWIDFETEYYDYLIKIYKENEQHGISVRESLILKYHDEFDTLKKNFINYLKNIDFDYNNIAVKDFLFKTAQRFTREELGGDKLEKIMLLCFNYTKSIDFLSSVINVDCEVNFIHGKLDENDSIIFGFGDELDENYKILETERSQELFKNVKSVHYFKYNNYNKLHNFIHSGNTYHVDIYGHSCGISDRTLLNEIFENKLCRSVRIFYHKYSETDDNFHDISVGLIRQFSDKQRMRSIVRPKNQNDILFQCDQNNN